MPSPLWRPRPRRPPSPLVEDELESLSHELGGLSLLNGKPGDEGVCERGSIDQYPILLTIDTPPRSSTADSEASQRYSLTSKSSRESLSGPPTPPPPGISSLHSHINVLHPESYHSQSRYHAGLDQPSIQPWSFQKPNPHVQGQHSVSSPDIGRNAHIDLRYQQPQSDSESQGMSLRRVGSTAINPNRRSWAGDQFIQSKRGWPEDGELPRSHKRPTVAELIEEKLKYRREQQTDAPGMPDNGSAGNEMQEPVHPAWTAVSAPQSPVHSPHWGSPPQQYVVPISQPHSPRSPHENGSSRLAQSPLSRNMNGPPQAAQDARTSYFPHMPAPSRRPMLRSPSYNHESAVSSPKERRVVSFADEIHQPRTASRSPPLPRIVRQVLDHPVSRTERSDSPPRALVVRPVEDTSGLALRPCQRSVPVAGYQDWYTISGLSHLNICPSCMNQIGHSRFRDFFVPSLPKPRDLKVRCSFSEPWTRLAWLQTIKKGYENLEMLYEITRPPAGCKPCPGRFTAVQTWYRIIDPETGMNLPKFVACSACVRNLRILMPPLKNTFRCSALVQERVCDLAVDSPRFVPYLDLLDAAANHCEYEGLSFPDHSNFVNYVRRKCDLRDCRRDRLILSTWHYIPELPELSICEDCYDDVVRPLVAAHKPIARMVTRSPRLLPGSGPGRCAEASCQLYSPRMRARFREVVLDDNYRLLKSTILKRYDAERRFRDRKQMLLYDESRGYDRDAELRQNAEEWLNWE